MIPKALDLISMEDLELLVVNAVKESRTLEYKEALPGKANSDTVPFLAEICAFANAMGGDFLIGIVEVEGVASEIRGIEIESLDQEQLRLESLLRDGIEPRLTSATLKPIKVADHRYVIALRVRRSWNAPHRVIRNSTFYGRNSSGKYPMDVVEIRDAFNFSSHVAEKIRSFRTDRIARLMANDELPVTLDAGGIFALHLIPLSSMTSQEYIDIEALYHGDIARIRPLGASGWNPQVNIDGFLNFTGGHGSPSRSYTQVFRTGAIEAVMVFPPQPDGGRYLSLNWIENQVLSNVESYCKFLKDIQIGPPLFVFLSLVEIKGYQLYPDPSFFAGDRGIELDRNIVQFPEVMIGDYSDSLERTMRVVFDMLWNAFGVVGSPNYDDNGNRINKKK